MFHDPLCRNRTVRRLGVAGGASSSAPAALTLTDRSERPAGLVELGTVNDEPFGVDTLKRNPASSCALLTAILYVINRLFHVHVPVLNRE